MSDSILRPNNSNVLVPNSPPPTKEKFEPGPPPAPAEPKEAKPARKTRRKPAAR